LSAFFGRTGNPQGTKGNLETLPLPFRRRTKVEGKKVEVTVVNNIYPPPSLLYGDAEYSISY
jgi:hypothetical protein